MAKQKTKRPNNLKPKSKPKAKKPITVYTVLRAIIITLLLLLLILGVASKYWYYYNKYYK
jgi:hypothetical protein